MAFAWFRNGLISLKSMPWVLQVRPYQSLWMFGVYLYLYVFDYVYLACFRTARHFKGNFSWVQTINRLACSFLFLKSYTWPHQWKCCWLWHQSELPVQVWSWSRTHSSLCFWPSSVLTCWWCQSNVLLQCAIEPQPITSSSHIFTNPESTKPEFFPWDLSFTLINYKWIFI